MDGFATTRLLIFIRIIWIPLSLTFLAVYEKNNAGFGEPS